MADTHVVSGNAIIGEELELCQVEIIIHDGVIKAVEEVRNGKNVLICPAFFNAHTHLGDTVAMDCNATGDLESIVAPPDGLKHRILAKTPYHDLVAGMRESIDAMISGGTAGCSDFREGGREGVQALRDAARGRLFKPVIFGRENGVEVADGLGISSTRDVPDTEDQVQRARQLGRKIAFHAGERDEHDIDLAIAYNPDLIIHATYASPRQLKRCADAGIPLAVCARSNWLLGVTNSSRKPPIQDMLGYGCKVYIGTDNVMFNPPDMGAEMAHIHTVYHMNPRDILRAAIAGSEVSGTSHFIVPGNRANFIVIDSARYPFLFSRDPVTTLVKRLCGSMIAKNVFNS